ncbi:MAG: acetyl-CoA carboxylase biotin carboxyl carrier protein [Cyanobacteria bacterium P01_D01_bin.73]
MSLNFEELRELIQVIGQTDIAEVTLKNGDFEMTVRKAVAAVASPDAIVAPTGGMAIAAEGMTAAITPAVPVAPAPVTPAAAPAAPAPAPAAAPPQADAKVKEILSPMVGTFYRAPAPGEDPFINVGDRVQSGQTVCIIEAMKLMNELEAELTGEIIELLVEDGQPVEFDQPLMRVRTD